MKFFISTLAVFLLLSSSAWADSVVELQILQEFFSKKGMENRSARMTAAALESYLHRPTVGEYLSDKATVEYRLLLENETSAIYEVTVEDSTIAKMWSAFFQRGLLGSKLEAIQSLQIPPYLAEVEYRRLLAQKGRSTPQEARLKQLQRLFLSTTAFKEDFNKNRSVFESIAKLVEGGKIEEAKSLAANVALLGVRTFGEEKSEGEMALLTAPVGTKKDKMNSQLGTEVRVSGFLDSVLGLLHLPNGTPPPISAKDYIFIEELAEDWYLFRNIATAPLKDKSEKND